MEAERSRLGPEATLAVVSILITAVLLAVFLSMAIPERKTEADLRERIGRAELAVYGELEDQRLLPADDFSRVPERVERIEQLEDEATEATAEANRIWNEIPAGEVIARGRPSGVAVPVGQNREVQELRGEARHLSSKSDSIRRTIARDYGHALLSTHGAKSWTHLEELRDQLHQLHDRHSWYYQTPLGTAYFVVRWIVGALLFLGIPASILMAITALGS